MTKQARKMRRGWAAVAAVAAAGLLLGACTASAPPRDPDGIQAQSASLAQSAATQQSRDGTESSLRAQAAQLWDEMTPSQRVASVLMLHYPGTDAGAAQEFVKNVQPGGLILMGNNIPPVESQLIGYIEAVDEAALLPLIVAVDQEGGPVSRLEGDPAPGPSELRDGDAQTTEEAFRARAEYLHGLGINTNLGVVADTTADPEAFISDRVLGTTPELAADHVRAAVTGEKGTVLSTVKHFPGHGSAAGDSHTSIPSSDLTKEQWAAAAAPPFQEAIEADTELVMVGHLRYENVDAEPASVSPAWHQILREEMGFQGIIISDDMQMLRNSQEPGYADAVANAVAALNAGTTMVLDIGSADQDATAFADHLVSGILASIEAGELAPKTLEDAGLRLLELRLQLQETNDTAGADARQS